MAKAALLGDIHGNEEALRPVLAFLDSLELDEIWCLGDTVDYGPRPSQCLSLLRERSIGSLLGNHDAAAVDVISDQDFHPECSLSLQWTKTQLSFQDELDLREAPKQMPRPWGLLAHGSPQDPLWHYVEDQAAALLVFRLYRGRFFVVGHTHYAGVFALSERGPVAEIAVPMEHWNFAEFASGHIKLENDARYIVNPGSVGQPRDGDPRASFCVVGFHGPVVEEVTWYRLPYDWSKTAEQIRDAGLPISFAERLGRGR